MQFFVVRDSELVKRGESNEKSQFKLHSDKRRTRYASEHNQVQSFHRTNTKKKKKRSFLLLFFFFLNRSKKIWRKFRNFSILCMRFSPNHFFSISILVFFDLFWLWFKVFNWNGVLLIVKLRYNQVFTYSQSESERERDQLIFHRTLQVCCATTHTTVTCARIDER